MNDFCIEDCAVKRDASRFEMKPGLNLQDLPAYPINDTEDMTKEEKYMSVIIYLTKVIDHLKGEDNGQNIHHPIGPTKPGIVRK